MATIVLNIPDAEISRIVQGFAKQNGYQAKIDSLAGLIDNPETRREFTKRKLIEYLLESVKACETQQAIDDAIKNKQIELKALGIN